MQNIIMLFVDADPHNCLPLFRQRDVHVDQPAGGGGGAGRPGERGVGPGPAGHQHRAGGALPHRRGGGGCGPRRHPHQLAR